MKRGMCSRGRHRSLTLQCACERFLPILDKSWRQAVTFSSIQYPDPRATVWLSFRVITTFIPSPILRATRPAAAAAAVGV